MSGGVGTLVVVRGLNEYHSYTVGTLVVVRRCDKGFQEADMQSIHNNTNNTSDTEHTQPTVRAPIPIPSTNALRASFAQVFGKVVFIAPRWFPWRTPSRFKDEPGAALFSHVRLQLTLWYSGVLAVALILFSIGLYSGVSYMLFTPIRNALADRAHFESMQWQRFPDTPCGNPNFRPDSGPPPTHIYDSPMVACFNSQGILIQAETSQQTPSSFLNNDVVNTALHSGPTFNTIYGDNSTGDIYRYALPVTNPYGQELLGVVLVGIPVAQQETALHVILIVQIMLGLFVLIGAAFGGLFLANRALAPTRLAFERQQRFIGDASHELRTPLTLLRADAEVLLRGRTHLPADDVALLEDIVSETSHMSTLATNMLVLARLDTMPHHLEQDIVDLNSVVNNVLRRTTALAEQMHITLQTEQPDSPIILGDAVLLEQALLILLDNAIKYNHSGGSVTVRTTVKQERAIVEVQDTGIGIDAEHLAHKGERFYRVDKARSREAGGTGLGLSIARGIITTHQSTLTLQSIPGAGTTVTLNLPCVKIHSR